MAGEGLTPDQRNVYDKFVQVLTDAGLKSLIDPLMELIVQGYGADTIAIELQQTKAYQDRFAGNQARVANGLAALAPGDYLALERSYEQVLRAYGLPEGFYDDPSDFADFIGKDISPAEIQDRAQVASDYVTNAPPEYKQALMDFYGIGPGDATAYFLDSSRAMPFIDKQVRAAQIGGAAAFQGLSSNAARAEELSTYGVDQGTARSGYAAIAENLDNLRKLATIDKTDYDQRTAEDAFLLDDAKAAKKTRRLASNERARFGGSSGVGQGSLSSGQSKGQY